LARQRRMSVEEAQATTNARQFAEWCVFESLDPSGEDRADWRAAMIASTVANAFRGRGQRAFKPQDFMPKFQTARQKTANMEEQILGWARMMSSRHKRRLRQ